MAVAGIEAIEAIGRGSMGFLRIRKKLNNYRSEGWIVENDRSLGSVVLRPHPPANELRASIKNPLKWVQNSNQIKPSKGGRNGNDRAG